MGEHGAPDFNALQNAFDVNNAGGIVYFLFDLPFFEGYDLRNAPLRERRQLLEVILADKATEHVRFSEAFEGDPATILASACKMKLEGIIAKRANGPYQSRRTEDWLKLKCRHRQEFVIGGYVDRAGAFGQVGSLLLGVYDAGHLMFAGSVGTGWSSDEAAALKAKLAKMERDTSPFTGGPAEAGALVEAQTRRRTVGGASPRCGSRVFGMDPGRARSSCLVRFAAHGQAGKRNYA